MSDSALRVPDVLARPTDPTTSHDAVADQPLNELRRIVLLIVHDMGGDRGMTDSEIDAFYAANYLFQGWPVVRFETPRRRRSDLANAGLVRDSGATEKNAYGRNETVWEITPAGVAALDRSKK